MVASMPIAPRMRAARISGLTSDVGIGETAGVASNSEESTTEHSAEEPLPRATHPRQRPILCVSHIPEAEQWEPTSLHGRMASDVGQLKTAGGKVHSSRPKLRRAPDPSDLPVW
jgi:hypothetical protein